MAYFIYFAFLAMALVVNGQDQSDTGFVCALNCTFRHANAWATVLSLNNPSQQLINWVQGLPAQTTPTVPIKTDTNDSLARVCDVYDSYNSCLNKCPDDMFRQGVVSSMSGIQMICTSQRKDVSSFTMPCVKQFTDSIQEMCRSENEALLSTTNQLQNLDRQTPAVLFVNILQRLCESALDQSRCVVPALQQKCGNNASDLLNQLMAASLGSVEKLIGDKRDMMPVQCKELFNVMVKHPNGSVAIVFPSSTPAPFDRANELPMADAPAPSDAANTTTQIPMRRSDDFFSASGVLSPFNIFSYFVFFVIFILSYF